MKYRFTDITTDCLRSFDLPENQSCDNYETLFSQVAGVLIFPFSAAIPAPWNASTAWLNMVDNTDTVGLKGKYLAVEGSFLPSGSVVAAPANDRRNYITERRYEFLGKTSRFELSMSNFVRTNMQTLRPRYRCWIETVGGRIIGGQNGLIPFIHDVSPVFNGGRSDKEQIDIKLTFLCTRFPESFVSPGIVYGSGTGLFWGDGNNEIWGGNGEGWIF